MADPGHLYDNRRPCGKPATIVIKITSFLHGAVTQGRYSHRRCHYWLSVEQRFLKIEIHKASGNFPQRSGRSVQQLPGPY
jgi:hypothetical protein